MTDHKSAERERVDVWKTCRISSCHRHEQCKYTPCRSVTTNPDARAVEIAGNTLDSVWEQAGNNHRAHSDTGSIEQDIRFLALGLTGEAGELANFVKKCWRDGDQHTAAICYEIADVCAYAFMLAATMGMTPQSLIDTIAEKQQRFLDKMTGRIVMEKPL